VIESVLNCTTEDQYKANVALVYDALASYPSHVEYFKSWFDRPECIAKYYIAKVRGGMCTIGSCAAEQCHASNEHWIPTKIMGLISPEQQFHELLKRSDDWIRRDKQDEGELEFEQARLALKLDETSPKYKALFALTIYYYREFFLKNWSRIHLYRNEPYYSEGGELLGQKVFYLRDDSLSVTIPIGERCPRDACSQYDYQCVHELVVDQDFILDKWQTRFWNNCTYKMKFGDGTHLLPVSSMQSSTATTLSLDENHPSSDQNLDPIIESTSDGICINNSNSGVRKISQNSNNPTYHSLMNEFGTLAEDVVRRPDISRLLMGFIATTKRMLSDSNAKDAHAEMLNIASYTKTTMSQFISQYPIDEIQPVDNSQSNPLKRARTDREGAVTTLRLKSRIEAALKKPREAQRCSLCKETSHRVSGNCPRRKEFGSMVKESEINQLVQDISNQNRVTLPCISLTSTAQKLEQMHPLTHFICIHGLAVDMLTDLSQLTQGSVREEANYICISMIFEGGVVTDTYDKCFVRSSAVVRWISKTDTNRKRVIMGMDK
jgi:hypothetical protein